MKSELMDALAGSFVGTDRIHASPWASAQTARVEADGAWELGGELLVQRWHDHLPNGDFHLVNVFMQDPATGEVLLYAFDSLGFPADPPARGTWADGCLSVFRVTERGQSRTDFTVTDVGFRWSKRFRPSAEADWAPVVDGDLVRVATRAEGA